MFRRPPPLGEWMSQANENTGATHRVTPLSISSILFDPLLASGVLPARFYDKRYSPGTLQSRTPSSCTLGALSMHFSFALFQPRNLDQRVDAVRKYPKDPFRQSTPIPNRFLTFLKFLDLRSSRCATSKSATEATFAGRPSRVRSTSLATDFAIVDNNKTRASLETLCKRLISLRRQVNYSSPSRGKFC